MWPRAEPPFDRLRTVSKRRCVERQGAQRRRALKPSDLTTERLRDLAKNCSPESWAQIKSYSTELNRDKRDTGDKKNL